MRPRPAISLAVSSTGALSRVETTELFAADQLMSLAEKAKAARGGYRAPGA